MAGADPKKVLHALGDPYGLALRPQTEELETRLELAMPEEEVTESQDLLQMVGNIEPILDKAKDTLIVMMDHMAEAYYHVAQAAEQFTKIAHECSTQQLMIIMKYAAWPIIQIEGTVGTEQKVTGRKNDLPDEIPRRVNLTLLLKPDGRVTKMRAQVLTYETAGRESYTSKYIKTLEVAARRH